MKELELGRQPAGNSVGSELSSRVLEEITASTTELHMDQQGQCGPAEAEPTEEQVTSMQNSIQKMFEDERRELLQKPRSRTGTVELPKISMIDEKNNSNGTSSKTHEESHGQVHRALGETGGHPSSQSTGMSKDKLQNSSR